jgi:hypothetical protein
LTAPTLPLSLSSGTVRQHIEVDKQPETRSYSLSMAALLLVTQIIAAGAVAVAGSTPAATSANPPANVGEQVGAKLGQPAKPVGDFVNNALPGLAKLTLERGRSLGKVVREEVKTHPSDWVPGEAVEMHTVVLDGLELQFASHRGRGSFLVSATFTKPSWKLRQDLGVGAPEARVLNALGRGGKRSGNLLTYFGDADDAPNLAEFTIEGGIVVKLKLIPYTG